MCHQKHSYKIAAKTKPKSRKTRPFENTLNNDRNHVSSTNVKYSIKYR